MLTFLAIDILYFFNSKLNGKVLRIELKQFLWGQRVKKSQVEKYQVNSCHGRVENTVKV